MRIRLEPSKDLNDLLPSQYRKAPGALAKGPRSPPSFCHCVKRFTPSSCHRRKLLPPWKRVTRPAACQVAPQVSSPCQCSTSHLQSSTKLPALQWQSGGCVQKQRLDNLGRHAVYTIRVQCRHKMEPALMLFLYCALASLEPPPFQKGRT